MKISTNELLNKLQTEKINTWFDLGIFIDRFKETKPIPTVNYTGTYNEYLKDLNKAGMAFVTFMYSIDGVTIEIEKYTKVFKTLLPNIDIHYIGGRFYPESQELIPRTSKCLEINEMAGFNDWSLYEEFFFKKLERGSSEYNNLIIKYWEQVLFLVEKIGTYIEENNIKLLYLLNVCSNPGNVALTLALVLVSEHMEIPVINNNHDFYWEGGNKSIDIQYKGLKKGPRDFFFTNCHLGEVFSLIEVLYPWESRTWMNININREQTNHLVNFNGHNPANVLEIGTAVDTNEYDIISKRRKINAFHQFEKILSRYEDTLIGYSVDDVRKHNLVNEQNIRPILVGNKTRQISRFLMENIILLQPTRIISRKKIELGFKLIKKMFDEPEFVERLRNTANLKLTLIITGPIANGHFNYFNKLLRHFSELLSSIDKQLQEKIYLAFLFSELDRKSFKERFDNPVTIPDLYNIASLVLLPSKTEGRGLPIIEATACGTPIFCRRYVPENVYSDVIGEGLPEKQRLKVIEFEGQKITKKHVKHIIDRILFPHIYTSEVIHNKNAVKRRFSLESLTENMNFICKSLHHQLKPNDILLTKTEILLDWYKKMVSFRNENLDVILNTEKREYLPGYGRLAFMTYLNSLIDPSAFRIEEQNNRGYIFQYARYLVRNYCKEKDIVYKQLQDFYNAVDCIFIIKKGETDIQHDHSFSYRHRNRNYYSFHDYTLQELTGLVNIIFQEFVNPRIEKVIDEVSHFFTDYNLAISQLTSSSYLAIDNRKRLVKMLQSNVSFGIFPGDHIKYELEFFILQAVRSRLKLGIEITLSEEELIKNKAMLKPVYVFANERSIGKWFNKVEIVEYINSGKEPELKLLYKHGILKIVESKQVSTGLHFPQMGEEAISILARIHADKGFIIAIRTHATFMSDIVNIDRFHIGKAWHLLQANILGIPLDSGYVQFVPAGIRTTLAYPTPIQTAKSFDESLKSEKFRSLSEKYGEEKLFSIIRKESMEKGSPIDSILNNLLGLETMPLNVTYQFVNGIYSDKLPWNGVYAKVNTSDKSQRIKFRALSANGKTQTVNKFVEEFRLGEKKQVLIAWNGGYILNPELVGKLGLPESYIGSPLGLLISDGEILCPPLFNKAALLIDRKGDISIQKVSSSKGITVLFNKIEIELSEKQYNQTEITSDILYYDLMHVHEEIPSTSRYIIRIAGNIVKEIIKPNNAETQKIIPVGLTFSFSQEKYPQGLKVGDKLKLKINGFEEIDHAIEAGPHLLEYGDVCIDMEEEGWKSSNSIQTQAARLDYTDMRGPKIAVGIDTSGDLFVLVINGRIRESVGATHHDMANILKGLGMVSAMGFDPGGSSTLVVNDKALNISPYNKEYEKNIYALPPEPRAVSNSIVGYIDQ